MAQPITKLTRTPPVHQSIQEVIKAYISNNQLKAGDALPPENDLAKQIGVSRNSVREAIKALESMGILETRHGSGVYVQAFSFEPLLNNLAYGLMGNLQDVSELLEIRRILELAKVDAAIEQLSQEQLEHFDTILEGMRLRAERNESFPEEDRQFHRLLFKNLGNTMLLKLIDVFWMAVTNAAQHINMADPQPLRTYQDHVDIVRALKLKDVEKARAALDQHYDGIHTRLQEASRR